MPDTKPKKKTVREIIKLLADYPPDSEVGFKDGTDPLGSIQVDGERGDYNRFREGALEQLFDEVSR